MKRQIGERERRSRDHVGGTRLTWRERITSTCYSPRPPISSSLSSTEMNGKRWRLRAHT